MDKQTKIDQDVAKETQMRRIVLWSLIIFFVTFASVDAFFIYKAVKTHTGVVTENAYEKGLNYGRTSEEDQHQNDRKEKQ